MSRPDWCPEDIWGEAKTIAVSLNGFAITEDFVRVARALLEAHQRGRREGMEEAAALLRDHATISNGESLDPAVPEILAFISAKAQEVKT